MSRKYSTGSDLLASKNALEVELDVVFDGAMHGLLEELDPHSQYIPSEDFTKMQEIWLKRPLCQGCPLNEICDYYQDNCKIL